MKTWKADLHIHSVLSPCGSLDSSPKSIVQRAAEVGLDIIAITDHNSTLHCELAFKLGQQYNLSVLAGAEVTTKEEIHCLALFETIRQAKQFQIFIEDNLPAILNNPDHFGDQVIVDELNNILMEYPFLLIQALEADIHQVQAMVHALDGLFIPAHIDKMANSLRSQLGLYPESLFADAVEISHYTDCELVYSQLPLLPEDICLIRNSDSHFIKDIGSYYTEYYMEEPTFAEIKKALKGIDGRKTIIR
jgi:PHP family Zn ribbon phosphoesterase